MARISGRNGAMTELAPIMAAVFARFLLIGLALPVLPLDFVRSASSTANLF
jgi:hypothetical protein